MKRIPFDKRGPVFWVVANADKALISAIADRACKMYTNGPDLITWEMDITACHLYSCKLDLAELLAADSANFSHDMAEINKHVDRERFEFPSWFQPRFASRS